MPLVCRIDRAHARRGGLGLVSETLERRTLLSTFVVINTNDAGPGSLRDAILRANANPGADGITFQIPGSGVQTISPASPLPGITGPVTVDGTSQPFYSGAPLIRLDGSNAGANVDGLDIYAGNCTVKGLVVSRFSLNGILLSGTGNNLIQGNFIGTNATGGAAAGNAYNGIAISNGSSSNQIIGNVVSGNSPTQLFAGIQIYGAGTNNNVVAGNYIGTDVTGTLPLGNGGTGVLIQLGAQGNRIGTNGDGVNDTGERNVISANGRGHDYAGIQIDGNGTNGNIVAGNYIGSDVTGSQPLGNGGTGVIISNGAQSNRIGVRGADLDPTAERNVISGNGLANNFPGINLSGAGTTDNTIAGNYVGINAAGASAMGNGGVGIYLQSGANNNLVGTDGDGVNDSAERNVISANTYQGIALEGASGNTLAGNYVGTDGTGTVRLGNGNNGVWLLQGATRNFVGAHVGDPDAAGEGNLISGNTYNGIAINDAATSQNTVLGNLIGTDITGANPLPNANYGIWIGNNANNNTIGLPGSGNRIAFNTWTGVLVTEPQSTGNSIRGNSIHNNGILAIDLGNDGLTVNHGNSVLTGPNHFQNWPVLTSATPGAATSVVGTLTSAPSQAFTIDFYVSSQADNPYAGAATRYLQSLSVITNADGQASFTVIAGATLPGQWVAATATDASGNTSELSLPIALPTSPPVVNAATWVPVGPSPIVESSTNPPVVSGRVSVAAADPGNPNVMYLGADGGGVWKTTDWLDPIPHWVPLTDNQPSLDFSNISYTALAVSASNPQTIYAAMSGPGGGVLKSIDGGATWTELANAQFNYASFASLVIDPTNPNTLFASVWFGATSGGGVYKSTNGGQTWVNTTASVHTGNAADLVMDPSDPSELYAGLVGGGATNGIYKTTDGGAHWSQLANGVLVGSAIGVSIRLAISPSNPSVVYATIFDPALGNGTDGLPHRYKTTDGGASWTPLGALSDQEPRYWHALLSVDPTNPSIVYVNGDHSLYRSVDGGMTWNHVYDEDPVNVYFDDGGAVIMTGDRGIYRWPGGASPFQNKHGDLQNTEFYTLTVDPTNPAILYGTAQDHVLALKSFGAGIWTYVPGGDEVGKVLVDPANPNRLYVYDPNNTTSFIARSDDAGATWQPMGTGVPTDTAGFGLAYTGQKAFALDPSNQDRILVGTDRVYETTNDAGSWHAISPVLSAGQYLTTLATAPSHPATVYAATGDGRFFVTNDNATWQEHDSGLPIDSFNRVTDMQVDPNNPQRVFAVTGGFLGGRSGNNHAWMTTNGGTSWSNITGNLPIDAWGQAIAVDWRFATPLLYFGASRGVYQSRDLGAHWSNLATGLPNSQVTDLQLLPQFNLLAVATYGRGVFELRIPSPLALLGDTNEDGIVNFNDLLTLAQNYGRGNATWQTGDFNGDGQVTFPDLLILAQHYGQSTAPGASDHLTTTIDSLARPKPRHSRWIR